MARLITLRVGRRADRVDHADAGVHVYSRPPADHVPQHEPSARTRRRGRARGQDRLHLEVGLLPGDAAPSAAEHPAGRRRRARRAIERRPLHGNARISSTGCRTRPRRPLFATGTPTPTAPLSKQSSKSKLKVRSRKLEVGARDASAGLRLAGVAALHRRRVERQRRDRVDRNQDRPRGVSRVVAP